MEGVVLQEESQSSSQPAEPHSPAVSLLKKISQTSVNKRDAQTTWCTGVLWTTKI